MRLIKILTVTDFYPVSQVDLFTKSVDCPKVALKLRLLFPANLSVLLTPKLINPRHHFSISKLISFASVSFKPSVEQQVNPAANQSV